LGFASKSNFNRQIVEKLTSEGLTVKSYPRDSNVLEKVHFCMFLRIPNKALSNGEKKEKKKKESGRISVVMSTFSVFCLWYGRSDNEFCAEEGQNPILDPLPRNEKLYGNLYSKSLFREMSYSFRSTVFVPMEFWNISCPKLNKAVT
jgi:hypothetical protein